MMSRPRAPGPELRGASHHPELALATQAQFATAPWHELAVESGRRVWRDRSTNLAVGSFQRAWSAIKRPFSLSRCFAGPGQHSNAWEHDLCRLDIEPSIVENTFDVERSEADSVWIIEDAAQEVPGRKRRPFMVVVDHKVMNQHQSARRERIHDASCQNGYVIPPDSTPQIRHKNYIVSGWPIGCDCTSSQMCDSSGEASLFSISSGRVDGLWKVEDGGGKFGICGAECERIGAAAAANVEQSFSAVKWDPLGHQACWAERPGMLSRTELLSAD